MLHGAVATLADESAQPERFTYRSGELRLVAKQAMGIPKRHSREQIPTVRLALLGSSALILASLTARAADTVVGDGGNAPLVFLTGGFLALAIIAGVFGAMRFRRGMADLRRTTLLLADKTQERDALAQELERSNALLSAVARLRTY